MVDRYEQFFLLIVEVKIRQEGVLNASFDGYLLLVQDDLVGLVNGKLIFGHFGNINKLIFGFHDMAVIDLLVDCSCGLMHQPYLVVLISNHNGIEVRKHLKICDDLVDGKGKDLGRMSTAINGKDSDDPLLST